LSQNADRYALRNNNRRLLQGVSITVYEHGLYQGKSKTFNGEVPDLATHGFSNQISSVKIVGDYWTLYDDPNFAGERYSFAPGDYDRFGPLNFNDRVQSMRPGIDGPDIRRVNITIYEHGNYGGKSVLLDRAVKDLNVIGMDKMISSCKIEGGPWVAFDDLNMQGNPLILNVGEYPHFSDLGFNDKTRSLRPAYPA
jgi:hypothetical protein